MLVATATWLGVGAGPWALVAGAAGLAGSRRYGWRRPALVAVFIVLGVTAGWLLDGRARAADAAKLPQGRIVVQLEFLTDADARARSLAIPRAINQRGDWLDWSGPVLLVVDHPDGVAGTVGIVRGRIDPASGTYRGRRYAGRVRAPHELAPPQAAGLLYWAGNGLRARVGAVIRPDAESPARALLAGFLIGDTRAISGDDVAALRRAGLSHFVAVSGSNVALFLAGWWLILAPFALDPRLRAAAGVTGLALFVVVTRGEPSVLRAAMMAGLLLVGRAAGLPLDTWAALGGAVTLLLLAVPDLAGNVGFQLSVAATIGVLIGLHLVGSRRPRPLWMALGGTAGAQAAVAPLLLWHFGSIPVLAPVTNLVAAPLVSVATSVGGLAVVAGHSGLASVAAAVAGAVLGIARLAAAWPQAAPGPALLVMTGLAGLTWAPSRRPAAAFLAVSLVIAAVPPARPDRPAALFLDVGQGDAALVLGARGEVVLVDGGPDPTRLLAALNRYGIRKIDLIVVSHRHADHTTGLVPLVDRFPVGAVWHPPHRDLGDVLGDLVARAQRRGIPIFTPRPGTRYDVGTIGLEVLGPLRRYASPNDESLVVRVDAGWQRVLFPGDVETIAQRELGPLPAEVLKVPHQGAATSDSEWLASVGASIAVVSVGPNSFGHPDDAILAGLAAAGATVYRTDRDGDVAVPLSNGPGPIRATGTRYTLYQGIGSDRRGWHRRNPSRPGAGSRPDLG